MLVYIKSSYKIEGRLNAPKDIPVEFRTTEVGKEIKVILLKEDNLAEAIGKIEANEKVYNFIETALINKGLPDELVNIFDLERTAITKVLKYFKYYLNQTCLSEELIITPPNYYWSLDGVNWNNLMPGLVCAHIKITYDISPKANDLQGIQECLNTDNEPFIAFRHLLRAKQEENPRYKWIDG